MGGFLFAFFSLAVVSLLVFLPIFVSVDVYFDVVSGKIGCQLSLYEKIKLLGGYLQPCHGGFAFHLSDKKAKLFTYRQIDEGRKQVAIDRVFTIVSIRTIFEIAPEYLFGIYTLESLAKLIWLFFPQTPTIENRVVLQEEGFRIFLRGKLRCTMLGVLCGGMKYLFRRWKRECRTKKSAIL
jgi:hypothetical protein